MSEYAVLKEKMIKERIEALVAKGYLCDEQGKCSYSNQGATTINEKKVEVVTYTKGEG